MSDPIYFFLSYQVEAQKNQFNQEQVANYQKYIGSLRTIDVDENMQLGAEASLTSTQGMQYNIDSNANVNGNVGTELVQLSIVKNEKRRFKRLF